MELIRDGIDLITFSAGWYVVRENMSIKDTWSQTYWEVEDKEVQVRGENASVTLEPRTAGVSYRAGEGGGGKVGRLEETGWQSYPPSNTGQA